MSGVVNRSSFPLRPMLQVALSHEFYGGGFDRFSTIPLPATAVTCHRLGLQLLQNGSTLTLYVRRLPSTHSAVAAVRAGLAEATLCWEIAPLAAQFSAVTGLDFAGSQARTVLTTSAGDASGGRLTVRTAASAKDVWPWRALAFDFVPSAPLSIGTMLDIANATGEVVARVKVPDPLVVPIDVSALGSGLYQLVKGKKVLARWFADERGSVAASPAPTSILVLPGALLAAAFDRAIAKSAPSAPPVYTAKYPARDVTWRYHIFNAPDAESLEIAALDENGQLTAEAGNGDSASAAAKSRRTGKQKSRGSSRSRSPFFAVSTPEFPNAASFESTRAFKLVQRPPQRFALLSDGATRFAPLPVASASFATRAQSDGLCSDIFVYL